MFYELEGGIRPLPDELGSGATGFLLSGNNHSDDLFMFLARRLGVEDGITAGQAYEVSFEIRFASNAPSDCFGVGGAPGESVSLKAGASGIEPLTAPGAEGLLMLNVDKGNQGNGGADVSVVGNIANGLPCEPDVPYVSLQRSHAHPFPVTASDAGELWLLIGTDSGFEATTALFYEMVEVKLSATDQTAAPTHARPVEARVATSRDRAVQLRVRSRPIPAEGSPERESSREKTAASERVSLSMGRGV